MEVCKNKRSNRYFIYIQNTGSGEVLLVTPEAQIKSLKSHLFEEIEEKEENYLIQSNLLSREQIQRLNDYKKNRSDEVVEHAIDMINELSPYDKKRLLEKLEKMIGDK